MALLDTYLAALQRLLPRAQRADIVAELRDALLSQIEDEQRARGRVLSEAEVAAILQRYGAPETVAARYGRPRYLIGPEIYSQYVCSAKVVTGLVSAVLLALAVSAAVTADDPLFSIGRALWSGAIILLVNLSLVTVVFIQIERMTAQAGWPAGWDPRDLVRSPGDCAAWWRVRPTRRMSVPRSEAIGGMCFAVFWLLWWTDVLPINRWFLWSRLPLEPAPIWQELSPLVMIVIVGSLVTQAVAIARPRMVRVYEVAILLLSVGVVALVTQALAAGPLVVVTIDGSPAAGLAVLLNVGGRVGLTLLAFVSIGSIAFAIFKWVIGREVVAVR